MNVLLIEKTFVVYSLAPQEMNKSSVVCFDDCFIVVLKGPSVPFRVDNDPVPSYGFPDNNVEAGLRNLIDSSNSEDELKEKLMSLVNNELCLIKFADFKKVKVKGFLGTKTLKVSNSAMKYFCFSATKQDAKDLAAFYSNL